MMLSGLYTALITPFKSDGSLDEGGLRRLIHFQRESDVDGLVILGTTGEVATLTEDEKERIIEISIEEKGALKIFVGTGTTSTEKTIQQSKMAFESGADGVMAITPYYIKPMQEGLFLHFTEIATRSPLPVILYNVPSRTGVQLDVETYIRLLDHPNIIGIKDASPFPISLDLFYQSKKKRPDSLYFSGDDLLTSAQLALGGDGMITASGNVIPRLLKLLLAKAQNEEWREFKEIATSLYPLFKVFNLESNPIMIKGMLEIMELPGGKPRLPMTPMERTNREKLLSVLSVDSMVNNFAKTIA